jgi:hypothetical protein
LQEPDSLAVGEAAFPVHSLSQPCGPPGSIDRTSCPQVSDFQQPYFALCISKMDCSYPLNSYDAHQTPVQDSNRRSVLTHSSRPNQPFSISRKPIAVNQKRDAAYTTLIDSSASGSSQSHPRTGLSRISFLRWWLPELFSSFLSVAALASTVIVLRIYDGRGLDELNLPSSLTLNGVIAAIATFNRVALMVPVGSAMSQEAWLWFSPVKQRQACRSRLEDLELSDAASRGPWGSFVFLYRARRRYVPDEIDFEWTLRPSGGSLILALS